MRLPTLWFMYRNRLRAHLWEEVLAVFGVAIGVALVFAVLVANQSIRGSVGELVQGIVGRSTVELRARSVRGFDQAIYERVQSSAAVKSAAPAIARRVEIAGPAGRRSVTLLGGDERLQRLGGALVQRVGAVDVPALSLPEPVARPLGLHPGQSVTVRVGERRVAARVGALLSVQDIGELATSPIVIAPLRYAQHLTDTQGRITNVLVEPVPGAEDEARAALNRLAAGNLDVRPSNFEATLMGEAAKSNDQSTLLFSAISAAIGLLFAYNAMLLTLPARRRMCAEMRLLGFRRGQVLASLIFETALLATCGVIVGLVVGDVLSRGMFGEMPRYLASAFPIGANRVVTGTTLFIAALVGVTATFTAAARPLRELLAVKPVDASHRLTLTQGERVTRSRPVVPFVLGLALLVAVSLIAVLLPSASLVAATLCAAVALAVLPLVIASLIRVTAAATRSGHRRAMAWIAVKEIAATPTRAVALAATAAVAVFGITTVEGARQDLIRGADVFAGELAAAGDVHVLAGGRENYLGLEPFDPRHATRQLRKLTIVENVYVHGGQLVDVGRRRLAVFGRPALGRQLPVASALTDGSFRAASARLNAGGGALLSSGVARDYGVGIGDWFALPTPVGARRFQVAAITTNYFWPPGAVVLGSRDFHRFWGQASAGEIMVDIRDDVSPERATRTISAALGLHSGLRVIRADVRAAEFGSTARQALTTLGQTRALILICAVLAVAAAMGVAIWQRRQRLAALKAIGFRRGQVLRLIIAETILLLTAGGVIGALLGLYAQTIASRWIETTSGSSVAQVPAVGLASTTLVLLVGLSAVAAALPGHAAAGVEARAAFAD